MCLTPIQRLSKVRALPNGAGPDTHVSINDFGGKLRQARERRGIALRQIAATTKISIGALEALERNDVSKLPGGIFSRAFVRSYATEVGLDPDETVREFLERFHGETAAAPSHGGQTAHHPAPASREIPARAAGVGEDESGFESQQRMAAVLLKLVAVSLPLVGIILYLTLGRGPATADKRTSGQQGAGTGETPSTEHTAAPAASGPAVAGASVSPAAIPADHPLVLEIQPTGACWVSLTVDGKTVFARLMQPGEKEVRQIRESAVIEVGDAGAFAFSINGRPGRSLGQAGQVKTARISRATVAEYLR